MRPGGYSLYIGSEARSVTEVYRHLLTVRLEPGLTRPVLLP